MKREVGVISALGPASAAQRMIRETIETLGAPGVLPSNEAVLLLYGPEPIHEGQAIVDALRKRFYTAQLSVGHYGVLH
jgi:hypothetical protein